MLFTFWGQRVATVLYVGRILLGSGAEYVGAHIGVLPSLAQQRHHRVPARHVAVHPGEGLEGEHPQFFVFNVGEQAVGREVSNRCNGNTRAAQRAGQAAPEVDRRQHILALRVDVPNGAAQPAFGPNGLGLGSVPDVHRAEVGAVGVLVADPIDDGHLALVPERLHRTHAGVEADLVVERNDLVLGYIDLGAGIVVAPIGVGNHRVEVVVSRRRAGLLSVLSRAWW